MTTKISQTARGMRPAMPPGFAAHRPNARSEVLGGALRLAKDDEPNTHVPGGPRRAATKRMLAARGSCSEILHGKGSSVPTDAERMNGSRRWSPWP